MPDFKGTARTPAPRWFFGGDPFKVGFHVTGSAGKRWSWTAGLGTEMRSDGKDAIQYSAAIHTGF